MKKQYRGCLAFLLAGLFLLPSCGQTPQETSAQTEQESEEQPIVTELYENLSTLTDRTTRPSDFSTGNQFSDLIYYDTEEEHAEKQFAALPAGKAVAGEDFFLSNFQLSNTYGKAEEDSISDGVGFNWVLDVHVTSDPPKVSNVQDSADISKLVGNGQYLLISFWMRNTGDTGTAKLIVGIEQTVTYNKLINVTIEADQQWRKFYIPVVYNTEYEKLIFRFGSQAQRFEIGGFCMLEYNPAEVQFEDLPDNRWADDLNEGAKWREEAWERIEEYRKGDFTVVVQDADGNVIPNAKVEAEMFEHEFLWTADCNSFFTRTPEYQENVLKYFNSAVVSAFTKWAVYEKYPGAAMKIVEKLNELGINRVRGHCLFWDRPDRDTLVPADAVELMNNHDALRRRILSHVLAEAKEFEAVIKEWDVVNEAFGWHKIQDTIGRDILDDCFRAARSVLGEDGILYFNDNIMDDRFVEFLNTYFVGLDIDYDGIGMQSHYSDLKKMEEIYDFYCKMESFEKRLKVTEYDFDCTNEERVASFTRDLMILSFSMEKMEGFVFWGIYGGNAVCFEEDWTPRLALEQIADLIYNKWWTSGVSLRTNDEGSAQFRGFFGGYYITVTHNGVRKKVAIDLFKNNDNRIVITMP